MVGNLARSAIRQPAPARRTVSRRYVSLAVPLPGVAHVRPTVARRRPSVHGHPEVQPPRRRAPRTGTAGITPNTHRPNIACHEQLGQRYGPEFLARPTHESKQLDVDE